MSFASAAQDPHPYDLKVNNQGVMLQRLDAAGRPGGLDGIPQYHQERVPFTPGTPTPEGAPYVIENALEQPEGFYSFSGGMGFREQDQKRDRDTDGYYHGHYIDSVGDYLINGPAVSSITPGTTDTTFGINAFFESTVLGTRYLMALSGRYCLQRTADTGPGWGNISKDFGAGSNAIRATVYRGAQASPYAFVAMQTPSVAAPAPPTVTVLGSGGTVSAATYFAGVSYTTATGESLPSQPYTTVLVGSGGSSLTFISPPAVAGATGYYAYLTAAGGTGNFRQQAFGSPTPIGTNYTVVNLNTAGGSPLNVNYWVWDMTSAIATWTQHASLSAIDFKTYHEELWMLNTDSHGRYQVQKCLDGGTTPTWSGAFIVADAYNQCTSLEIHDDRLYVRSQQGLLAVAAGENDVLELTGGQFKYSYTPPNNCTMASFGQFLIVPLYRSLFAYQTDGTMDEIGLGTFRRNDSPVSGIPTALAAYANWFVYAAFYNASNNTAYLMKWGTWKHFSTLFSPIPKRVFVPAWNGALWEQPAQINAMFISEVSGQPTLYFGDAAGNIGSFALFRNGPDMTEDPNYQFNTSNPMQVYMPAITRGNPGINKCQMGIEITGQNLNVAVTYRTDLVSAYGNASNLEDAGLFNDDPGNRLNFTVGVVSRWLDCLCIGTAASATTPCIIKTFVVYQTLRPVFRWIYQFKVRIGDRVPNRLGNEMVEMGTPDWMSFFESLMEAGPVALTTPEGRSFNVLATDFKIDSTYWEYGRDIEYVGTLEFMEHVPAVGNGTHVRLANYDHAALGNYTHSQLAVL